MRATKEMLDMRVGMINRYTHRHDGEKYYVGYENGYANLFLEYGSGRQTISYGNTKGELMGKLDMLVQVLAREAERRA